MANLSAAEKALAQRLYYYKRRTGKLLMVGLLLAVTGAIMFFAMHPDPATPRDTLWLYRTFGERGLQLAPQVVAVFFFACGCYMFYRACRRNWVLLPRVEAHQRKVLGLPPALNNR